MDPKPKSSKFDSLFPVAIQQEAATQSERQSQPIPPTKSISAMGEISIAMSGVGIVVALLVGLDLGPSGAHSDTERSTGKKTAAAKRIETKESTGPTKSSAASLPSVRSKDAAKGAPGVTKFVSVAETPACHVRTREVAQYLQRGEVALTSDNGLLNAAWLVKVSPRRPEALLAFAAFQVDGQIMASPRSVGTAFEMAPQMLASRSEPTLFWFDAEGLVFTQPMLQSSPSPTVNRIRAIDMEDVERMALAETPAGSIVGVMPLLWDKTRLGLFSVVWRNSGSPSVKAIGATHRANKPRWPALAADSRGYTLAWHEEGDRIAISRFDLAGDEIHAAKTIAPEGTARGRVHLVATTNGAMALWTEGEQIVSRAVDADMNPRSEAWVVGHGKNAVLTSLGDGALAVFLGTEGTTSNQILAVKLGANGSPSVQGIRISDGSFVDDTVAVAREGLNVAFLWAESSNMGVSTKSAQLRIIDVPCLP